jgi:hypothetical protein
MRKAGSRWLAVLLAAMTALGGAGALAQGVDADIDEALLLAEDLPEGMQSLGGITTEPAFDIDSVSFEEAGGLAAVAQTWQSATVDLTTRVVIVFDFRMLFPDETAAAAYLDGAEEILSEVVTGVTLQPDTPPMGDDLRHYAGQLSQGGMTIEAHNFLIRRGRVVAKVYIGGFDTTLEDASPIAEAAVARIDAWAAAGPTGTAAPPSPGASASPTTAPAATATPIVTPSAAIPGPSQVPAASLAPSGTLLRQWAVDATASSQYGEDAWSAMQATGEPDVDAYSDDIDAWAPAPSDGTIEWLEVGYAQAVIPTAVTIVENLGNGAVTTVEALDRERGEWVVLWSGTDPSPQQLIGFSPRLADADFPTDRLRITLDSDLVAGWNEIDAVELVGTVP